VQIGTELSIQAGIIYNGWSEYDGKFMTIYVTRHVSTHYQTVEHCREGREHEINIWTLQRVSKVKAVSKPFSNTFLQLVN
jgi:hypothetical protein